MWSNLEVKGRNKGQTSNLVKILFVWTLTSLQMDAYKNRQSTLYLDKPTVNHPTACPTDQSVSNIPLLKHPFAGV